MSDWSSDVCSSDLDTPYGFQENAGDISTKAQEYFRASVGHPITVATWREAEDDTVARERALAAIADARYVFAGPGSPTSARAQWRRCLPAPLLVDQVRNTGADTFAPAAAPTPGDRQNDWLGTRWSLRSGRGGPRLHKKKTY